MAETMQAMEISELERLLAALRDTPAMRAKQAIQRSARLLAASPTLEREALYALPGDDTAAIRIGELYHLFAIEGMLPQFVEAAPWFAGWSAVMANVSDITAMGGRACAVVNAYWHHDTQAASKLIAGIRAACEAYGIVLAGGHTSQAPDNPAALAVAITGVARRVLSSLHVAPGQVLAMAVDLTGNWHADTAYWKAFEQQSAATLRARLEVIPRLAEAGLLLAAKDISNAGVLGSLLMLLEPTGSGALVDLDAIPAPTGGDLSRWLRAFPSYGFLLTLDEADWPSVQAAFAFEGVTCARIGHIDASARLTVARGDERAEFWNLDQAPFTGFVHTAQSPQEN